MEDFTFPSIRASFKKWGCCRHTPPLHTRSLGPCYMQGPIKKITKKKGTKKIKFPCGGAASVFNAGPPQPTRLPRTNQRLLTVGQGTIGHRRPLVSRLLLCKPPFLIPSLLPPSYLLPPIFCTCGQLFLIVSNTCPPCPNFS
jgi:hypothetical protein